MRRALVALALVSLAACSGGQSFDSAEAVAGELDCDSVEASEVYGATEAVECAVGGETLRVSWFEDDEALSGYRMLADAASESDMFEGDIVYGDNWAVECPTDELCEQVTSALA